MRILLVHNAAAGDTGDDRRALVAQIEGHGHAVTCVGVDERWFRLVDTHADLVVAAGGDGTIGEVARQLTGRGIPMGVLPMGTANNVAHGLGLAGASLPDLIARWDGAQPRAFDVGRVHGGIRPGVFIESAGLGLIADAIADIAEGASGYVDQLEDAGQRMDAAIDVLRRTVRSMTPVHMDLILDGRDHSGTYLLVEVMNGGRAGPNLRLAPDASAQDGCFDVVLADEDWRQHLIDELPRYREGTRPATPVPVLRARHVTVSCPSGRLHVDDTWHHAPPTLDLLVDAGALTLLI